MLCGVPVEDDCSKSGFTAEGMQALCEGLKGSTITSLKCAASHSAQCPVTTQ